MSAYRLLLTGWHTEPDRLHPSGVPGAKFSTRLRLRGAAKLETLSVGGLSLNRLEKLECWLLRHTLDRRPQTCCGGAGSDSEETRNCGVPSGSRSTLGFKTPLQLHC